MNNGVFNIGLEPSQHFEDFGNKVIEALRRNGQKLAMCDVISTFYRISDVRWKAPEVNLERKERGLARLLTQLHDYALHFNVGKEGSMSRLQPEAPPKTDLIGDVPKIPVQDQSAGQILGALSVLLVLLTPVAYLNGRAFHDGWYAYFKLDPYMFPLDTAGILHNAPMAWVSGIFALAHILTGGLTAHWGYVVLYLLSLVLIWNSGGWLLSHLKRRKKQRPAETIGQRRSLLRRVLWRIAEPLMGLGISVGALYIMLYGLSMVVILLVLPFERVGRHEAKLEVERHLQNMPVVTLKSPKGDQADYHIVGCGPQFCGVFGEGHAITVPVSAITWAISSPPDNR